MTDAKSDIPSVVERTRPIKADAPVVAAHFLGQTAVFVLGEEALLFVPNAGEPRTVAVHGGAILCSTADRSAHRYRRGRWQGGVDRRAGREHRGRHRRQAPLDRPCGGRPERRGRVVGGQAGVRAQRQGSRAHARGALDRRRIGVRAEGRSPRDRALQRRHALVRQRAERARDAGMERARISPRA